MNNYFRLVNSFIGDIYFEVSKHLRKPPSWVMKNKFQPDVKFLIMKYSQIYRTKQKEYEKLQNDLN